MEKFLLAVTALGFLCSCEANRRGVTVTGTESAAPVDPVTPRLVGQLAREVRTDRVVVILSFSSSYSPGDLARDGRTKRVYVLDTRVLEHSPLHGPVRIELEGEFNLLRAINLQPPELGKISTTVGPPATRYGLDGLGVEELPFFLDRRLEEQAAVVSIAVGEPSSGIADFSFFGPIDRTQVGHAEEFLKYLLKRDRENQQLLAELDGPPASEVGHSGEFLQYVLKHGEEKQQSLNELEGLLDSENPFLVLLCLRDLCSVRQSTARHYFRAIAALPPEYASVIVVDLFRWSMVNPKLRTGTQWETLPEALLDFVKNAPVDKQAQALAEFNKRLPAAKGFQRMPEDATERLMKALGELTAEREGKAGWAEVVGHYKTLWDQLKGILQERREAGAQPATTSERLGE